MSEGAVTPNPDAPQPEVPNAETSPPNAPAAMLPRAKAVTAPTPSLSAGTRDLVRWVGTNNPFYVLSAGLFLGGLWVSFGDLAGAEHAWALMAGLAGYTLLLAAVAYFLVRFGNVWDDMRTILLVVVMMFLVTALTFDRVLVADPLLGVAFNLGGYGIAMLISELVLRGIRLSLPILFRLPYHLIIGVFFLYPLALSPLLAERLSETLLWALFGFSAAAGLAFLTLLPAIRRGPNYVRDNGSPWVWPAYPWVLFGLLAMAVPVRAFLVCWALQTRLIFGPYFLAPFGLCCAVLLLEVGLVARNRQVLWLALLIPVGLLVLTVNGHHQNDQDYRLFLETFSSRLGGFPLFVTLLATIAFYAYAAWRRVARATEALTAALVLLAFVSSRALVLRDLAWPQPWPILAAAALQLGLGLWRRDAWRCLVASGGLIVVAVLLLPTEVDSWSLRGPIAFHMVIAVLLVAGAAFDNLLCRGARMLGLSLALGACLVVMYVPIRNPAPQLTWVLESYPFVMATLLALYGMLTRHRVSLVVAGLIPSCWLAGAVWRGYSWLRHMVVGLDYIVLSVLVLALAIGISLFKAGALPRRLVRRKASQAPE
ncbi:MAG: hypothetical protein HY040_20785 [Planctomycetes bacterium]|nr:hypothetical protein [Planctomycetota bacterium]